MSALVERLATQLGVSHDRAESVVREIVDGILADTDLGSVVHVTGLGTFRREKGALVFEPEPRLAAVVNHRFAGLAPIPVEAVPGSMADRDPGFVLPDIPIAIPGASAGFSLRDTLARGQGSTSDEDVDVAGNDWADDDDDGWVDDDHEWTFAADHDQADAADGDRTEPATGTGKYASESSSVAGESAAETQADQDLRGIQESGFGIDSGFKLSESAPEDEPTSWADEDATGERGKQESIRASWEDELLRTGSEPDLSFENVAPDPNDERKSDQASRNGGGLPTPPFKGLDALEESEGDRLSSASGNLGSPSAEEPDLAASDAFRDQEPPKETKSPAGSTGAILEAVRDRDLHEVKEPKSRDVDAGAASELVGDQELPHAKEPKTPAAGAGADSEAAAIPSAGAVPRVVKRKSRSLFYVGMIVVLLVALIGTLYLLSRGGSDSTPSEPELSENANAAQDADRAAAQNAGAADAPGSTPNAVEAPPIAWAPGAIDRRAGGYTLVVSSQKTIDEANAIALELATQLSDVDMPIDVLTGTARGERWYRVAMGQFSRQSVANRELRRLAEKLPEGAWVLRIRTNM